MLCYSILKKVNEKLLLKEKLYYIYYIYFIYYYIYYIYYIYYYYCYL